MDESFDQAVACLESVEGVQELSFTDDLDTCREQGFSSYSCRQVGTEEYRERLREIVTKPRGDTIN